MALSRFLQPIIDFCLTVLLWAYFLFGYLFILFFLFVPTYVRMRNSEAVLQKMNHVHLKGFFAWLRILAPGAQFNIAPDVRGLRSSIIVCNHISYLDPILLVSLFERQTTIVKNTFFRVPIFGWFLRKAGYVPSSPSEIFDLAMNANLEAIRRHLAAGGNLFVFPEGTRSRGGKLVPFNKGVFSIARYCNTGLKLVYLHNTDQLFPPGSFSFRMREKTVVSVELIASLDPDYSAKDFSISALAERARRIFEQESAREQADKNSG